MGAPTFDVEARALAAGEAPVAGIDEAGRGPWAGPVVAAAVILDPRALPAGIDDSKTLTAERRDQLFDSIMSSALGVGVGIASVEQIDSMNILRATFWAMTRAVDALATKPRLALVDGKLLPHLPCAARAIIGGDATSLSIGAASIIAKVTRDRIMLELARTHPGYGFERHKGYGTPEHKAALSELGVCVHHRRSFRPVRNALPDMR
jgi:ribonuclease HII